MAIAQNLETTNHSSHVTFNFYSAIDVTFTKARSIKSLELYQIPIGFYQPIDKLFGGREISVLVLGSSIICWHITLAEFSR